MLVLYPMPVSLLSNFILEINIESNKIISKLYGNDGKRPSNFDTRYDK